MFKQVNWILLNHSNDPIFTAAVKLFNHIELSSAPSSARILEAIATWNDIAPEYTIELIKIVIIFNLLCVATVEEYQIG